MVRSDLNLKWLTTKASGYRFASRVIWSGCVLAFAGLVHAAEETVIVGKNNWLFVRYGVVLESLDPQAQASFRLLGKLKRMLEQRGVALAVTLVPSKIEIHAEHLPDNFKVSSYMQRFNDSAQQTLRGNGVEVIDLKERLREAALKDPDNPLFYRLDTHWTRAGALVAAQTVRAGIVDSPVLKKALNAAPVTEYKLDWSKRITRQKSIRDIVKFLPPGTPEYPPEETRSFTVARASSSDTPLLGPAPTGEVALVGSSNSGEWTGFPDALRYTLQRSVFNYSVDGEGHWGRVRDYLANDAFQVGKPPLILLEVPLNDVGLGPNYQFRSLRYRMSSADWLLQVAALVEPDCQALPVQVTLASGGLGKALRTQDKLPTSVGDFVDLEFDKPVDVSGYFSALLLSDGSNQIDAEIYSNSKLLRKFKLDFLPGDERANALKTPLALGEGNVTRLRLYPGKTQAFSLKNPKVCRYRENWLKDVTEF